MTVSKKEIPPAEQTLGRGEATTDLVKQAFEEATELGRLELALAKSEAISELRGLKRSAVAFGIGAGAGTMGACLLLVAIAVALGGTIPALLMGVVLVGVAGIAVAVGYSQLPTKPLAKTATRLETDVKEMKERIA